MRAPRNTPWVVLRETPALIVLDRATNPANRDEDVDDISKFCDQVNQELEGPQIAVKLLAHKIQSPQEREALYALAVSRKSLIPQIVCFLERACII